MPQINFKMLVYHCQIELFTIKVCQELWGGRKYFVITDGTKLGLVKDELTCLEAQKHGRSGNSVWAYRPPAVIKT